MRDPLPLELRIPTAPYRPGDAARFAPFPNEPGDLACPDTLAPFESLREHATGMIRVLDDDGVAHGPWDPRLSPQELRHGLEMMLRSWHLDRRMMSAHRQGRLSFYLSSRGEEAVAVAGAMPYAAGDMLWPSYRQPGLFLARGMPLLAIMSQCLGHRLDVGKGRQMPIHYTWRAGNVVSISSPVGTQLPQAVGAAMAFAYRGERQVAAAWVGDGTTAQGDFHYALNFASVYRPPCVLQVVDNQWAISTHRDLATGGHSFAARADAYSLPGLRVDGNDFLAVYGAGAWAVERARRGGGPTLIELVTYRCDAHSTSDDPTQYRAADEAEHWPGGDPIERLKRHLIRLGQWSDQAHAELEVALEQEVRATWEHALEYNAAELGDDLPAEAMFDDVYAQVPPHLARQLDELRAEGAGDQEEAAPDEPPSGEVRRAAG